MFHINEYNDNVRIRLMSNTDVPQKIYKDTPIANVTVFDAEKSIGIYGKSPLKSCERICASF